MKKNISLSPCYYCGTPTQNIQKLEVFSKKYELPCCSEECKEKVKEYNDWDNKYRLKSYLILAVCVIFNFLTIGYQWTFRWHYLSLTSIGVVLYFFPLLLFRYTSYMNYGIKKTLLIIRVFAVLIILASIVFLIFSS